MRDCDDHPYRGLIAELRLYETVSKKTKQHTLESLCVRAAAALEFLWEIVPEKQRWCVGCAVCSDPRKWDQDRCEIYQAAHPYEAEGETTDGNT